MKKQKRIIEEDGIEFDSYQELYFYWWCKELKEAGYIKKIEAQPKSFELSSAVKVPYVKPMKRVEDKVLEHKIFNEHVYTTDFRIIWSDKAEGVFTFGLNRTNSKRHSKEEVMLIPANEDGALGMLYSFIEVKPKFDQNNMTRLAKINIWWVWEKYNKHVDIVIPEKLFKKTFTPDRYLITNKSAKARKLDYSPSTLNEFVRSKNNSQLSLV